MAEAPLRLISPISGRLDKALVAADAPYSRSRLAALIAEGAVTREDGGAETDPSAKVAAGDIFLLDEPPPTPLETEPEDIPLSIAHEDEHLVVVDKPAGMVVHPAPGAMRGTLVAALLHHCGDSLSGVGGAARPGIVHRIDKDTSGLLVVAKTDAAHHGLAAQFAAHSVERAYLAALWGAPDRGDPRLGGLQAVSFETDGAVKIDAPIARHRSDRKKMAVVEGGKRAVTRARLMERLGPASLAECRLETGRTHQIRVHMAHIGHPLIGDPLYGGGRKGPEAAERFARQALHARLLGFEHPATGERMRFESDLPEDFANLLSALRG